MSIFRSLGLAALELQCLIEDKDEIAGNVAGAEGRCGLRVDPRPLLSKAKFYEIRQCAELALCKATKVLASA